MVQSLIDIVREIRGITGECVLHCCCQGAPCHLFDNQKISYLRAQRQRLELTLGGVSAATKISVSTLSRLESGQRRPNLELLLPLARVYGVSLDDLIGARRTSAIRACTPARSPATAARSQAGMPSRTGAGTGTCELDSADALTSGLAD